MTPTPLADLAAQLTALQRALDMLVADLLESANRMHRLANELEHVRDALRQEAPHDPTV